MRFHSVASPLIALRFRFGSRRSDSVPFRSVSSLFNSAAVRCVAFLFRFHASPRFAFPLLCLSQPIQSIPLRRGASPGFSVANRVVAYLFRCGYLPVLPKPFSPRSPLAISSAITTSLVSQAVTTSCDILSPRFTV